MNRSRIPELANFSLSERSVYGQPIFAKAEDLQQEFVFFLDRFITWIKQRHGKIVGQFIVHDFNMRTHHGQDHPNGIAVDGHFNTLDLFIVVEEARSFGWRKVYFYPEWESPGIHLSYYPTWQQTLLGYGYYENIPSLDGEMQRIQKYKNNADDPIGVCNKLRES